MIKTALVFGGAYALGSVGGAKIASLAKVQTEGVATGIKIGVGVVSFMILSSVLR